MDNNIIPKKTENIENINESSQNSSENTNTSENTNPNNYDGEYFYDNKGKKYTTHSILGGIVQFTTYSEYGFDSGDGQFEIGSGLRREVAKSLGFSDNPTKAEADAKMATINITAYPGRTITVHKDLINEVQGIFKELKKAGVNLNEYIGGYNYRAIKNKKHPGSKILSMHALGCAIDINYNINGFVMNGKPLISGDDTANGKVRTLNSPIVHAFSKYGWGWGGRYGDYMHFSKANGL